MPKAEVKAVALKYWAGLPAPFIAAKGKGRAAQRLLSLAREAGVPVMEESFLAEALFPSRLGDYIPESCFEIAAKVFAFVASIEESE